MPNDATWKSYAQLGWVGMTVSEAYGGVGLGLAEEVMLFREIGRYLARVRSSDLHSELA